jgi:hypothetical protein
MLEFRLKAYRKWLTMAEPDLAQCPVPPYQLPGHRLLLGSQAREKEAQQLG